jgi:hypothetical protein
MERRLLVDGLAEGDARERRPAPAAQGVGPGLHDRWTHAVMCVQFTNRRIHTRYIWVRHEGPSPLTPEEHHLGANPARQSYWGGMRVV